MSSDVCDISICNLSFHGDWTPLNRLFFSQCTQDSYEERSINCQQKKWKKTRYFNQKSKSYRNYTVYEYVSSESDVSTSNELNSADNYEEGVMVDDDKSCSEPEAHIFNGLELERNNSKKPNINSSNENDGLFYEVKERIVSNKPGLEPEVEISDEMKSEDEYENNMHLKLSSFKDKQHIVNKNEWEMISNTSVDYSDSSDSSYDYKVPKKKRNQNSKSFQLSEYEKMVQKNKEEKLMFLKSLKVFEAKENFVEAVKTRKLGRSKKEENNKRKDFRNLDNCLTEEIDKAKICRRSTRQKNVLENKDEMLASSQSSNKLHPDVTFEKALKRGQVYHDFISEVGGSEYKMPKSINNDFKSHFKKMALQETQMISNSRISSIVVHESQEKIIICAGNGNGEIIFWHVNSDYDVCTFQLHLQKVTCLKFSPYSPNSVISSSFDGTMYCGDFEKKIFYEIFKAKSCAYFDFFSPTSYLVAHAIKYVSIIDIRTHRKTFEKRHKCNEDAVKTVSLHPLNKNYFISSHEKGSIRLWDLRKLQNEPMMEVYCKGERLISSSYSPVTGNSVLVTMDNTLSILDSSSRILNKQFKLKDSIPYESYNFPFTSFQATWLPNTDDTFVIGSKLEPRRIEIFDDKLCNIFNFTDKHFKSIPFINVFHSSLPFLVSASKNNVSIFSDCE